MQEVMYKCQENTRKYVLIQTCKQQKIKKRSSNSNSINNKKLVPVFEKQFYILLLISQRYKYLILIPIQKNNTNYLNLTKNSLHNFTTNFMYTFQYLIHIPIYLIKNVIYSILSKSAKNFFKYFEQPKQSTFQKLQIVSTSLYHTYSAMQCIQMNNIFQRSFIRKQNLNAQCKFSYVSLFQVFTCANKRNPKKRVHQKGYSQPLNIYISQNQLSY
eukprot:TRINITY_DN1716_c2_g2_i1.p1 TRINITY_DN1716_c2_g2~~TRINITY_DN1716_c2_g2_i1.p1  ORF type:complete len:229 (-),score=-23.00 TRINITY_DN1716_c2_g2_i1:334-978(-)